MVLHEAKYDQAGSAEEFLSLALTPLCNSELFPDAYSTADDMDGGAFPMPLFAFGDSAEDDEDDMEEDNFDDMEEEDFDDEDEDDDDEDDDEDDDDEDDDFDDEDYDDEDDFDYDDE
ncbi:MAG: hypothetical protein FWG89_09185 [Treponema sp.]|nr:hypothetical protein [Treponema sp.]